MNQPRTEWNAAIAKAKRELGFTPNEYVKDWDNVVAMAKAILAEHQEEVYGDRQEQLARSRDKAIFAHYLSGK